MFVLIGIGEGQVLFGQTAPQFSQYMYNKQVYNPAVVGSENAIKTTLDFRSKWLNLEGQPVTQSLTAHGPVGKLHGGIGGSIINDQIGARRTTQVAASYAYIKQLDVGKLSLGIRGGVRQYQLDGTILTTPEGNYNNGRSHNDDNVPLTTVSTFSPQFSTGVFFSNPQWYGGLSATNIIASSLELDQTQITLPRHYYITGGYKYDLNEKFSIVPSFLVKSSESKAFKTQLDINTNIVYKNNFLLGVSYRSVTKYDKDGIIAIGGIHLTEKLYLGYSYDFNFSKLANHTAGSHEVLINYRFDLFKESAPLKTIYSPRFL